MFFPIILIVGLVIWGVLIWLGKDAHSFWDIGPSPAEWFGLFGAIGMIAWFGIIMAQYSITKAELRVIDEKIELTEEMNQDRIDSVLPILEKYPEMEKDIISNIDPNAFAVLGDVYPDLKANESYTQQAELVKQNIAKIEQLRNEKLDMQADLYMLSMHLRLLK